MSCLLSLSSLISIFLPHLLLRIQVLLVNRAYASVSVTLNGAQGGTISTVDEATGCGPYRNGSVSSNTINMAPFAVSMVTLPN